MYIWGMAFISKKKLIYPINEPLRDYLKQQERDAKAISYDDLTLYSNNIPL